MRYTIIGKNIDIGERTKEKVAAKMDRVKKLFPEDAEAVITISTIKQNSKVEVTIPVNKRILRAEAMEQDVSAAMDRVVDIVEKQIVKLKKRLRTKVRQNISFKEEYESVLVDETNLPEEPEIKIVKNKRFELRPMDEEEAIMQMELLGHGFFVFRNGDTDEVNVVYKRHDGTFGLIEPEY